jgi:hypothetical protein
MKHEDDYVLIWEAPKLEAPEFRLYYDDHGAVICYTGDKSVEGNYIVIDAQTFAEARPDVRVIDGRVSRVQPNAVVYKLMPDVEEGITCHPDDVSVIVDSKEKHTKWKLNIYELQ